MRTLPVIVTVLLLLAMALPAQTMVKDIYPGSQWSLSSDLSMAGLNGIAYFNAYEPVNGNELWRSDGTLAGTWMVKDINTAPGASGFPGGYEQLVMFNGALLLAASDGTLLGTRLWRSDGTAAGTVEVSSVPADPSNLTVAGNRVFFFGTTAFEGRELWVTDGTAAGTQLVADLAPGPRSGAGANGNNTTDQMVAVGNNVFYAGGNPGNAPQLCTSDGTTGGTRVVAVINPHGDALPTNFTAFGNRVLFSAYEPAHGKEFWVSDGATTQMLKDINPGLAPSWPYDHGRGVAFGGRVFFWANDVVNGNATWVSDGTPAGTQVFFAPYPGLLAYGSDMPISAGDRLYFRAYTQALGWELYASDGIATPSLVRDLNPGPDSGMWGTPDLMRSSMGHIGAGRVALYSGNDGTNGHQLAMTDGTSAGTRILANLSIGAGSSSPKRFTQFGDQVFFVAQDGVHGQELWVMPASRTRAADATSYGAGCPGTLGRVPSMGSTGAPRLGNSGFEVVVTRGLPLSVGLLLGNVAAASLPIGPCTLLVAQPSINFVGLTGIGGTLAQGLPIPNDLNLVGAEVFWQGIVLDPLGSLLGIASASDGLRVRIGF